MLSLEPHLITRFAPGLLAAAPADLAWRVERRLAARRHAFAGAIALRLGQPDRARAAFRRAREIDPGEPGSRRALAGMGLR
jgi:Flp pilus assembly protein TadD